MSTMSRTQAALRYRCTLRSRNRNTEDGLIRRLAGMGKFLDEFGIVFFLGFLGHNPQKSTVNQNCNFEI